MADRPQCFDFVFEVGDGGWRSFGRPLDDDPPPIEIVPSFGNVIERSAAEDFDDTKPSAVLQRPPCPPSAVRNRVTTLGESRRKTRGDRGGILSEGVDGDDSAALMFGTSVVQVFRRRCVRNPLRISAMASTTRIDLLRDVATGDPNAWDDWVRIYVPLIHRWLRRSGLAAEDIEDVVQGTLIQVHRGMADFEHNGRRGAFRRWLRVVTMNALRQSLRGRDGETLVIEPQIIESIADGYAQRERRRTSRSLRMIDEWLVELESQFEAKTLAAFRLTFLDDLSIDEAAERLEMSISAVYIARSRILKRLRKMAADK